jgi:hypothetical protein
MSFEMGRRSYWRTAAQRWTARQPTLNAQGVCHPNWTRSQFRLRSLADLQQIQAHRLDDVLELPCAEITDQILRDPAKKSSTTAPGKHVCGARPTSGTESRSPKCLTRRSLALGLLGEIGDPHGGDTHQAQVQPALRARHRQLIEFTFDLRWVEIKPAALLLASQSAPSDLARLRLTLRRERYATYDSRKRTTRGLTRDSMLAQSENHINLSAFANRGPISKVFTLSARCVNITSCARKAIVNDKNARGCS